MKAEPSRGAPTAHSYHSWVLSIAGNVALRLCGLISGIIVARTLGPHGRGIAAEAVLWPTMVAGVGVFVSLSTATYFGARRGRDALRACLTLGLINALALVPISWAINGIALADKASNSHLFANWFSIVIPLTLLTSMLGAALLVEGRISVYWSTRSVGAVSTLVFVVLFALAGRLTVGTYITSLLIGAVIVVLRAGFVQRTPLLPTLPSVETTRDILAFGSRAWLTVMVAQLHLRLDQLFISAQLPTAVLGQYTVAFAWSTIVTTVGTGFSTVVLSRSAQTDPSDPASLHAAITRVRRAGIIAATIALMASAAAPIGILALFGMRYRDAVVPAMILSLAAWPICWKGMLHEFSRGIGKPSVGRMPELVGLLAAAIGLSIFLERYGTVAAATVSLISYLVVIGVFTMRITAATEVPVRAFAPTRDDVREISRGVSEYLATITKRG